MFMLTDTTMTIARPMLAAVLIGLLTIAVASAQESSQAMPLTLSEYEAILARVLRCPDAKLRETRDFQLCLLIVPPGHRSAEYEMLASLTFRDGAVEMLLVRPEQPLWRYAAEIKATGVRDWEALSGLKIRAMRSTDPAVITRVAGRSWRNLRTEVVPEGDWYMDPTQYRIHSHTLLRTLTLDLRGPGPSARRQPSEVLSWAERVRKQGATILNEVEPVAHVP